MHTLPFIERDGEQKLAQYAWPGGYTILYLDKHAEWLCADCATKDYNEGKTITCKTYDEGPTLNCAGCNTPIESSYGNPEEV